MQSDCLSVKDLMNHLQFEKSPYLQQHVRNPVDWYPWGNAAFELAKKTDRPIFLSIGYSTCHWCHVMEHESFEDGEVAHALNADFVSIKVDREERPDVDALYMEVIQAISGHGGWPMSVFLTPDLKPIYGGTYFPKDRFLYVLGQIKHTWTHDRSKLLISADKLLAWIEESAPKAAGVGQLQKLEENFIQHWQRDFDSENGGKLGAPKFPPASDLRLALRVYRETGNEFALQSVQKTLDKMGQGGIYDHLAGGFHRYATDERWLIPHFEKMLYDQAAMAEVYREAFQVTGKEEYRLILREIFDYVADEMTSPQGGFFSAEDADSEGVEGKFYVWDFAELKELLSAEELQQLVDNFDISAHGNFEEKNILELKEYVSRRARDAGLVHVMKNMKKVRDKRIRPLRDEKVLTAWNGLMISAFANGSALFADSKYKDTATRAADFIWQSMRTDRGELYRRWIDGESKGRAFLEDYAFLIAAFIDLFQVTADRKWMTRATELQILQDQLFWDEQQGGYYFSEAGDASLIRRKKDYFDNVTPSGNSVALSNLERLHQLTSNSIWKKRSDALVQSLPVDVERYPWGFSRLLMSLGMRERGNLLVLVGDSSQTVQTAAQAAELLGGLHARFFPNLNLAVGHSGLAVFDGKTQVGTHWTAYLCDERGCQPPVTSAEELFEMLK